MERLEMFDDFSRKFTKLGPFFHLRDRSRDFENFKTGASPPKQRERAVELSEGDDRSARPGERAGLGVSEGSAPRARRGVVQW